MGIKDTMHSSLHKMEAIEITKVGWISIKAIKADRSYK